jgi:hypothetical protein
VVTDATSGSRFPHGRYIRFRLRAALSWRARGFTLANSGAIEMVPMFICTRPPSMFGTLGAALGNVGGLVLVLSLNISPRVAAVPWPKPR